MAAGLDVTAAVLGIAGFAFHAFRGCIEGYKILHDAQQVGSQGDLLRVRLQVERTRLNDWGQVAGIGNAQPNERLNWALIKNILQTQHSILTRSEKLRELYGIDIPEVGDDETSTESKSNRKEKPTGLGKILASLRPELYSAGSQAIYAKNTPLTRLRWALVGHEKLTKIVNDLRDLNTGLVQLLEPIDREWTQRILAALWQDLLSRSRTLADVDALQQIAPIDERTGSSTIAAAAEFKKVRLLVGWDKRDDEQKNVESSQVYEAQEIHITKRLRPDKLDLPPGTIKEGLTLATYRDSPVLVEWRSTPGGFFRVFQPYMEDLAFLLGNAGVSFAALPCFGYLALESQCLFGFVYRIPRQPPNPDTSFSQLNLAEAIQQCPRVPLTTRVQIAVSMAEALLELHTAGWLHKGIRSDKVLFIHSAGAALNDFLVQQPYLVGYEAARPDDRYAASTLSEVNTKPIGEQLYQHPDTRPRPDRMKVTYRKEFDLYALGCLLVELALWEPLVTVYNKCECDGRDWTQLMREAEIMHAHLELPSLITYAGLASFRLEIEHSVGPTFLDAIRLCVSQGDAPAGGQDTSLVLQRAVVEKLRACQRGL